MVCPEGRRQSEPGKGWAKGSLTEAEEQRVHTHAIDTEESMGNQVGADDHRLGKGNQAVSTPAPRSTPSIPHPPMLNPVISLLISPQNNSLSSAIHAPGFL